MAKVEARCPHCQAEIHVLSEWPGESAACPVCGKHFTITFPGSPAEKAQTGDMVECPACHVRQAAPPQSGAIFCVSCREPFLFLRQAAFRCAVSLPDKEDGSSRVACPYCGSHYRLNYIPQHGLVGCQNCMKLFAHTAPPSQTPQTPQTGNAAAAVTVFDETVEKPVFPAPETNTPEEAAPQAQIIPPKSFSSVETVPDMTPFVDPVPQDDKAQETSSGTGGNDSKLLSKLTASFGAAPAAAIMTALRLLGNTVWLVFGGLISAVVLAFYGILICCTIIGIPFGIQFFKIANLMLAPYGADVYRKSNDGKIGCLTAGLNVLWLLLGGLILSFCLFIFGAICFITVIGIPVSLQYFKFAKLMLSPFGVEIRRTGSMRATYIISAILLILLILAVA